MSHNNLSSDNISAKLNNLATKVIESLELSSLDEEIQVKIKKDVLAKLMDNLIELTKILVVYSKENNVAIKRRIVMDFKSTLGISVDGWGVSDLDKLVALDEKKWDDLTSLLGSIARNMAVDLRDRSYFSDIFEDEDEQKFTLETKMDEVSHILHTDIKNIADNVEDYVDHTKKVVDGFTVKNHELRVMLNNALYKLTKMKLSFAQMDIIGTDSMEEKMLKKDIEREAVRQAKNHGISNSSDMFRDIKGYNK